MNIIFYTEEELELIKDKIKNSNTSLMTTKEIMTCNTTKDTESCYHFQFIEYGRNPLIHVLEVFEDSARDIIKFVMDRGIKTLNYSLYDNYLVASYSVPVKTRTLYTSTPLIEDFQTVVQKPEGVLPLLTELNELGAKLFNGHTLTDVRTLRFSDSTLNIYAPYVHKEKGWRTYKVAWFSNDLKIQDKLEIVLDKEQAQKAHYVKRYAEGDPVVSSDGKYVYKLDSKFLDILPYTLTDFKDVYSQEYMLLLLRKRHMLQMFQKGLMDGLETAEEVVGSVGYKPSLVITKDSKSYDKVVSNTKAVYTYQIKGDRATLPNIPLTDRLAAVDDVDGREERLRQILTNLSLTDSEAQAYILGFGRGYQVVGRAVYYEYVSNMKAYSDKELFDIELEIFKMRLCIVAYEYNPMLMGYERKGVYQHNSSESQDGIKVEVEGDFGWQYNY